MPNVWCDGFSKRIANDDYAKKEGKMGKAIKNGRETEMETNNNAKRLNIASGACINYATLGFVRAVPSLQ